MTDGRLRAASALTALCLTGLAGATLAGAGEASANESRVVNVTALAMVTSVNGAAPRSLADSLVAGDVTDLLDGLSKPTQAELRQRRLARERAHARHVALVKARRAAEERRERIRASRSAARAAALAAARPAPGAATAVAYAMSKVGDAYVWGAVGPSAFDCSGLMMAAWGAAGVSLPHSSSAQRGYGRYVSSSELQPGDLVFYYSPISHVGMYIGHGMIVHAENPSMGVRVSPVFALPYVGAVRPG